MSRAAHPQGPGAGAPDVERVLGHLERLAAIDGAPGHEHAVADDLVNAVAGLGDADVDVHGNLVVRRAGPAAGPRVLVTAHMDEVALVVKSVQPDGFLRVSALGSVVPDVVAGRLVRVGGHLGVIGVRSGHFRSSGADRPRDGIAEAYVDVGASSAEAVRAAGIDVGTPVVFWNPVQRFGVERPAVVGQALDDRLGCALLLTLLERETPPAGTLVVAFTVQEEVGLRGAGAVAHAVAPDFALALDTIVAGDTPDMDPHRDVSLKIGAGPAMPVATGPRGSGLIVAPPVLAFLRRVAARAGVALQPVVFTGGDNDATSMAWAGAGHAAASICIARRYSHTPVEVAAIADVAATYAWLRALVAAMAEWPDGVGRALPAGGGGG